MTWRVWAIVGACAAAVLVATLVAVWLWPAPTGSLPAMSADATTVVTAQSLAKFEFAPPTRRHPVPTLAFADGAGKPMTLAGFRGRVVLLNLWATWCVPCRAEMPALDRLQAKLGGPDFQVVPVSIDRKGLEVVTPFYRDLGLAALPVYVDQSGAAAREVKALGIPTTLLVDRDGREIGRRMGPAEWDGADALALIRRALEEGRASR